MRSVLKLVGPNKVAGPNKINGKILKNCAVSLAYPHSIIFKASYDRGMMSPD